MYTVHLDTLGMIHDYRLIADIKSLKVNKDRTKKHKNTDNTAHKPFSPKGLYLHLGSMYRERRLLIL